MSKFEIQGDALSDLDSLEAGDADGPEVVVEEGVVAGRTEFFLDAGAAVQVDAVATEDVPAGGEQGREEGVFEADGADDAVLGAHFGQHHLLPGGLALLQLVGAQAAGQDAHLELCPQEVQHPGFAVARTY